MIISPSSNFILINLSQCIHDCKFFNMIKGRSNARIIGVKSKTKYNIKNAQTSTSYLIATTQIVHVNYSVANIYLFQVYNRNTRKRCEIYSKLTIKTPERLHLRRSGVFIDNFEHILHLFLVFLLFILIK